MQPDEHREATGGFSRRPASCGRSRRRGQRQVAAVKEADPVVGVSLFFSGSGAALRPRFGVSVAASVKVDGIVRRQGDEQAR